MSTRKARIFFSLVLAGSMLVASPAATAGFNADGDPDLILANAGQANAACIADGVGGYACSGVSGETDTSTDVALGDVDGDGDLDAVFGNAAGSGDPQPRIGLQKDKVCFNNGSGSFNCSDMTNDSLYGNGVALADLDADGDLDAVFAGSSGRVCANDGSGSFTCGTLSIAGDTRDVALGDVDGDGDVDAVFALDGSKNLVCDGNGALGLSCSDMSVNTDSSEGVALGDVDGDGYLDAVFSNDGEKDRVCLNSGTGAFTCDDVSDDTLTSMDVALGDVDEDGDMDAVFAVDGGKNQATR